MESTYYGEEVIGHPNHHVRIRRLMPRTVTRVFDQQAPRCPCRCSTWYSSETAMNFDGPPGGRTQQKSLGFTSKSELTMVESQELSLSHINMKIISKYMMMTLMMRTQQSWIQKYGGDKDCFGLINIFFVGDIILYIPQIPKNQTWRHHSSSIKLRISSSTIDSLFVSRLFNELSLPMGSITKYRSGE